MKFAVICNEGFESFVVEEIKRLLPNVDEKKIYSKKCCVVFESSKEDVLKYVYLTQSAKKVLAFLDDFEYKTENQLLDNIKKIDFRIVNGSFCVRSNDSNYEKSIGSAIYSVLKSPQVNLNNPDYLVYIHLMHIKNKNKVAVIGIDITQKDMSKRSYKIFSHPSSIKGTLAYYLIAFSGFKGEGVLVDPCAGSGTIAIEAALLASGFSARYFDKKDFFKNIFFNGYDYKSFLKEYDKSVKDKVKKKDGFDIIAHDISLPAVHAMKKNFKIAGVDNIIEPARGDIDWLEIKFKERSVDYIVTNPPDYTKFNIKKNDKFFDIFFYQCEYVMKNNAKIVILTNSKKPVDFAQKYGLKLVNQKTFQIGNNDKYIFVLRK